MDRHIKKCLTIAGSDSGGGAGIQADLKTFGALGVHGSSVVTAITAQNTKEVSAIHNVPLDLIEKQIDAVLSDIGANSVKIGMLSNADIIKTVATSLKKHNIENIVLDPVMVAASGSKLLEISAIDCLKNELIPLALVLTPNLPEAEILTGMEIKTEKGVEEAVKKIMELGCKNVLLKGGHLVDSGNDVVDLFYDGNEFMKIKNKKIGKDGHGTGCTLSSAIAAFVAKGFSVKDSVINAIRYVHGALESGYKIGSNNYVLDHFWKYK